MKSSLATLGAVLTGAALAATGLTASAQAAPSAPAAPAAPAAQLAQAAAAYTPPAVTWGKCAEKGLQTLKAQCGNVVVPLDYAKPGGTKIRVAVSRIKHSSGRNQGVMLVNPGGPGGEGRSLVVLSDLVPGKVAKDYDWIGFDPRGVGASTPSLSCDPKIAGYDRPLYEPRTPALEQAWVNKAKKYAADCGKAKGAALLDHVKTTDNVLDMDSIRKALGRKQINYYGYSYGTYLGQVYSTLFPNRVRRLVMDGLVDPTRVWYRSNQDQDIAFDKAIKAYWAWIAKYDSVYHLGKTEKAVEKMYYTQRAKLEKKPALGKIGASEWTELFLPAGYNVGNYEGIAQVISAYVTKKDAKGLVALYDDLFPSGPGSDNGYAMYLATICTDADWPSLQTHEADNARIAKRSPYYTWANGRYNLPCNFWPADNAQPVTVDGRQAPKALLINETNDAATPYSGALEVRRRFPGASLIEGVGGYTHAGSLNGVACTDDAVAAYLKDGTLPKRKAGDRSDKTCPPNPVPNPKAAKKKASATVAAAAATRF